MKKRMIPMVFLLLSTMIFTGCASDQQSKEDLETKKEEASYNEELKGFAYQNETAPMYFSGGLDYGHSLIVKETKEEDGKWTSNSEILIDDLSGGQSGMPESYFKQKVTQIVNSNSLVEKMEGDFRENSTFYTNKVLLKTPLVKGNTWEQRITLKNGEEALAKTTIEDITGTKGNRKISTVTYIEGKTLEKYPNQRYEERATYQEGKGLVYFEHDYPAEVEGMKFYYRLQSN